MLLIVGIVAYWQFYHRSAPDPELPEARHPSQPAEAIAPTASSAPAVFSFETHQPSPKSSELQQQASRPERLRGISQTTGKTASYQGTAFRQQTGDYPFYVAEKIWHPQNKTYEFQRKGMHGSEIPLRVEARRYFLSENQNDYPEPTSGCGPTALLNLYIWYSKFGLLEESIRHSNPVTYKRLKFLEIDRKLFNIQRASRSRKGGTNTLAAIVAMDELVQEFTRSSTRLHFEIKQSPLGKRDFTRLSKGYRVGILSVRPKDPRTGLLMGHHAVLCIRGDTSGMVTVANWGDFSHGSLVNRPDGQWFVPRDSSQHELRINHLTTLIPFVPKAS